MRSEKLQGIRSGRFIVGYRKEFDPEWNRYSLDGSEPWNDQIDLMGDFVRKVRSCQWGEQKDQVGGYCKDTEVTWWWPAWRIQQWSMWGKVRFWIYIKGREFTRFADISDIVSEIEQSRMTSEFWSGRMVTTCWNGKDLIPGGLQREGWILVVYFWLSNFEMLLWYSRAEY